MTGILMGTLGSYGFDPGAMELITSQTLSVNADTFTLASVPSTYKHLQIRVTARMASTTATDLRMRVNGLSTTIYTTNDSLAYTGTTETGQSFTAQTSMVISPIQVSTGVASIWTNAVIDLYNYSSTAGRKLFTSQAGYDVFSLYSGGQITLATAITSVTLFGTAGQNMLAGSEISIYGIKG